MPPFTVEPRTSPSTSITLRPPFTVSRLIREFIPSTEMPPLLAVNASSVCRGAQISKLTDHDSRRCMRGPSAWMLPLAELMTICRAMF
jgi:hypothetical protein